MLEILSFSDRIFKNSPYPRDCDAHGVLAERLTATGEGMALEDFAKHPIAMRSSLSLAHILALRLYTTAAYTHINNPLRAGERHPLPVTVALIAEGIKKLRAKKAAAADSSSKLTLWRGM